MSKGAIIVTTIGVLLLGFVIVGSIIYKDDDSVTSQEQKVCQASDACGLVTVEPSEFKNLIEGGKGELIDVRTQQEHETARIADSTVIDVRSSTFGSQLDSLDKTKTYLIYCNSGNRSGNALYIMKQKGFESVYDLDGGIQAWAAIYDVVSE